MTRSDEVVIDPWSTNIVNGSVTTTGTAATSCTFECIERRAPPPMSVSSDLNDVDVIYCEMDDDDAVGVDAVDKTIGDGDDVA